MANSDAAANAFARIVLEQTQPEQLNNVLQKAALSVYTSTKQSVKHEQKAQQTVDTSEETL